MKSTTVVAALVLCLVSLNAVRAEDAVPNGLKDAKVGDWAEYSMKGSAKGHDVEMTQKRTVTAKDEKSITVKTDISVMGHAVPGREITIPLDKPYNPGVNDPDAKVEKVDEGDEKVTVNGKDYDAHWMHYKGTSKAGTPIDGKVWMAKGIGLGGMVKMEGTSDRGAVTMQLTNFGSK